MNAERRKSRREVLIAWCVLVSWFIIHHSSFIVSSAHADTVWINSGGGGNALELPRVQINDIKDGKLLFVGASGRESSRELSQIARITVDDDANLNVAEDAANQQKWDVATDAYRRVMATSAKPWARLWATQRLIIAAQKANRFDAAAGAYVGLVLADPAVAGGIKLTLPDERSTFLTSALKDVASALADPALSPAQRKLLLQFQLDLQRAKKDQAGAARTAEQLLQSGAAAGGDPNAAAALVKLKLDQAALSLQKREYAKVITEIKSAAPSFTEPTDQAHALLMIADAQSGLAGAANTLPAWQDAALAYMRVVAHFKDNTALAPQVAKAMLRAGQIEEQLKDRDAAKLLYDQLIAQYPSDPSAAEAKAGLGRLKATP